MFTSQILFGWETTHLGLLITQYSAVSCAISIGTYAHSSNIPASRNLSIASIVIVSFFCNLYDFLTILSPTHTPHLSIIWWKKLLVYGKFCAKNTSILRGFVSSYTMLVMDCLQKNEAIFPLQIDIVWIPYPILAAYDNARGKSQKLHMRHATLEF